MANIHSTPLYGLVLAGGKSTRMGRDKGIINYHGIPQREYLYHLLSRVCDEVFLSLRSDQLQELKGKFKFIVDQDRYSGPYNGLLSAHHQFPQVAWLVLACDLPLMDLEGLKHLVAHRNLSKMATAFALKEKPLPEPLAAIWEPDGLEQSEIQFNNGSSTSLRKYLINSSVELVFPERKEILLNANSKDEYAKVLAKFKSI
ncbi:NTP transferase domain-containing protein [Flavobacteriaceae bacterium F89]|uniref:Probable molybdenum cofactor guanylyltransferase n=1 Tax=Cerina litoralis TaxID=2874477 RepID=A0AAE3EUA4_9FLAO|nr:NTP transferase domain-containing protein [Cerina litoralis]MCG2460399.1 NTP transferase domain-containing protein [Cerina litoralis]